MTSATAPRSSLDTTLSKPSELEIFEKNYKKEEIIPDYLNTSSKYFTSTGGAHRLFQAIRKFLTFPILYANDLFSLKNVTKIIQAQSKFKTAEKLLLVPKMIFDAKSLNDTYQDYKKEDDKHTTRRRDKVARKIVEIVADCSVFLQLGEMLGIYALGAIIGPAASFTGSLFLFFQNIICLKMEREDFISLKALHVKEDANIKGNERLRSIFSENKNLDLIKLTKTIISVALSVFLLAEFLFAMTILSPTTLLFLSTTTTILAIWSHFYQESMTYPYIKC